MGSCSLARADHLRTVLTAIAGLSTVIPVAAIWLFLPHRAVNWAYFSVGLIVVGLVCAATVSQLPALGLPEKWRVGPLGVFSLACACTFGTALVVAGSGLNPLATLWIFLLDILFIAIVGSVWMQALGWAVTTASLIWSLSALHFGMKTILPVGVVGAWIFGALQAMVYPIVSDLGRRQLISAHLKSLSEALLSGTDLTAHFETSLDYVKELLPLKAFSALIGEDPAAATVLVSWAEEGEEPQRIDNRLYVRAAFESRVIQSDWQLYIGCGAYFNSPVVVVIESHPLVKAQSHLFLEVGESLASIFTRAVASCSLVSRLVEESITDPLTGLLNRRLLFDSLERERDRCLRHGGTFSVLLLDLDHFKRYNDALGHPEGDRALVAVAQVLRRRLREEDIVSRYGGEEFCVLLPLTPADKAAIVAEDLRSLIEGLQLPVQLTVSIGLAEWDGIESVANLVARADQAMYAAKRGGRNRVVESKVFG